MLIVPDTLPIRPMGTTWRRGSVQAAAAAAAAASGKAGARASRGQRPRGLLSTRTSAHVLATPCSLRASHMYSASSSTVMESIMSRQTPSLYSRRIWALDTICLPSYTRTSVSLNISAVHLHTF